MVIKVYHTDNLIFNTSDFMEDMLKKHQQIRFSAVGALHQNVSVKCTINMVVTMTSIMLMHDVIIFRKDTFSTGFG